MSGCGRCRFGRPLQSVSCVASTAPSCRTLLQSLFGFVAVSASRLDCMHVAQSRRTRALLLSAAAGTSGRAAAPTATAHTGWSLRGVVRRSGLEGRGFATKPRTAEGPVGRRTAWGARGAATAGANGRARVDEHRRATDTDEQRAQRPAPIRNAVENALHRLEHMQLVLAQENRTSHTAARFPRCRLAHTVRYVWHLRWSTA